MTTFCVVSGVEVTAAFIVSIGGGKIVSFFSGVISVFLTGSVTIGSFFFEPPLR